MSRTGSTSPAHLSARLFPQPTLSLYLGGSGHLVGESLKTLLLGVEEPERLLIESFFLDAQEPAIEDHERARHYCYRDLNEFFSPIYKDFSDERFPEHLGANPVMSSCDGCGVTRIFGAASLVACRDDFSQLVESAVARLKRRRRESSQPIQVFLTASSCGGTGAGMILDAAALVRHLFRQRLGENPRIFFFLLAPEIFIHDPSIPVKEEQRDRMLASNYALLKELHHFAQGHEFVSSYRLRDEDVRIGNDSDEDRLFDWVFYLDGKSERATEPRSLAQMAWIVAEAQLHLALTEVGRKVIESLPNQREERVREYAIHHVNARKKAWMNERLRRQLGLTARRTFLASLSVQNVRFPADEIKRTFAWRWTEEGLARLVRHDPADPVEAVEELDRLLGYSAGEILPDGILASWGLERGALAGLLEEAGFSGGFETRSFSSRSSATNLLEEADAFLARAESLLGETSALSSGSADPAGRRNDPGSPLRSVLELWERSWDESFSRPEGIEHQLWKLAADELGGRGLGFVDELVRGAIARLHHLVTARPSRPRGEEASLLLTEARESLNGFRRSVRNELKSLRFRVASFASSHLPPLAGKDPHSPALRRKITRLASQLNALGAALATHRSDSLIHEAAPQIWRQASHRLQRWREASLLPALTVAESALTLARSQHELSRQTLKHLSGVDPHGRPWLGGSTVQGADSELLESFSRRLIEKLPVAQVLLRPLLGQGVTFGEHRITVGNLGRLERETVAEGLFRHVERLSAPVLSMLDSGWMLPELRSRLPKVAAPALDRGLEPLTAYSEASVGCHRQGYLLVPQGLVLPEPFGRLAGGVNRLQGDDPMRLGVVSFTFGIPPNTLDEIGEAYAQYLLHCGDSPRRAAIDRYPLHVFRGVADRFDEPYSPLGLPSDEEFLEGLIEIARHLGWESEHGEIELDIRCFPASDHPLQQDWNRVIELAEKILASQPHAEGSLKSELSGLAAQAYRRLCAWREGEAQPNGWPPETGEEPPPSSGGSHSPDSSMKGLSSGNGDHTAPASDHGEEPL